MSINLTTIIARHVLNSTKVPLHADADAVILIGQLQTDIWIVVEGLYLARDTGEVLHAALFRPENTAAGDLCYTNAPRSVETATTRDEG